MWGWSVECGRGALRPRKVFKQGIQSKHICVINKDILIDNHPAIVETQTSNWGQ